MVRDVESRRVEFETGSDAPFVVEIELPYGTQVDMVLGDIRSF